MVQPIQELYEVRAVMAFEDTFVRLRKERGWTQNEVADKIDISVGQVKKYEKDDSAPTLHILAKIAMVFGVNSDVQVFEHGAGPAAHKLDAELVRHLERVAQLPDR